MEYKPRSVIVGSHTVHIFNNIRCCQLFSKVVVPICIAMKSVREFLLLSIFTNTCYYRIFSFCQSYGYIMVSSYGLNLHSSGRWWLWVSFVFLLLWSTHSGLLLMFHLGCLFLINIQEFLYFWLWLIWVTNIFYSVFSF